ncbi:MAG: haloacid dehalogenase type II, partial [Chloroflexi bacterium]|nr:haloacid dehalogenase type II [Chloroflexota bacterium]
MPRVILFDVNETLLDLRALDPEFARVFGDASARQQWFGQFLQSALVTIATDSYIDFGTIGGAALEMTAARRGVSLSPEDRAKILGGIKTLPPHPEVRDALEKLKRAGLRLASLTNSTRAVAEAQLKNAGLAEFFEQILSADDARKLKPAPEPYRYAAQKLGVPIQQTRLVAAHAWDVAGALRAGCAAAFVARPGMVLDPLAEKPDV